MLAHRVVLLRQEFVSYRGRNGPTDCPTGKSPRPLGEPAVQPLSQKYFCFSEIKSGYVIGHPVPERGASAIVTNVGAWSGGRGGARAHRWSQGGFHRSVSGQDARRRTALKRTAKACGPDASVVGVKSRGGVARPTGRTIPLFARRRRQESPILRGEHAISRKTIAQGMPECFR